MYVLFEISDKSLIIIGTIFVLICLILFFLFKWFINRRLSLPISEDERFEKENIEIKKEPKELTEEQIKAKEELERVYNQMSADLESSDANADPSREEIDDFEREQEENAIISYKELMRQADKLKAEATKEEAKDVAVTQLNIDDVLEDNLPKKEKYHGFKNSDIISPIYGIQNDKKAVSHDRISKNTVTVNHEKIANDSLDKQQEEMNDFLNSLKEFRKNL